MDEMIFELLMRNLQPQQQADAQVDPRDEAHALLLQRVQQGTRGEAQDTTDPRSFSGGGDPNILSDVADLTSFADIADVIEAFRDRDPKALAGSAIAAILGAAGAGALGRRVLRGRRAARAGGEAVEEGGDAIGQLRRELRERRSSEQARRGATREGPQGRRASDVQSTQIMGEVERIIAQDILDQAQRQAQVQARGATDPVTELLRMLNPPR